MGSARFVWELSHAALASMDGDVVMLKVYMDESGTHDGSPVVTVAAYIGKPREWEKFTKAWNAKKRPIQVFHSADCQALRGEFKGWKPEDRDDLVKGLLAVIHAHELGGFACGINLRDLDEALRGKEHLKAALGSPYATCFHWVVQWIMDQLENTNSNQRVAFFHESNDFQQEALAAFDWIQKGRKKHNSMMTLTFAGKADFVPLQAADILAYETNKRGRDLNKEARRSLKALGERSRKTNGLHQGEYPLVSGAS